MQEFADHEGLETFRLLGKRITRQCSPIRRLSHFDAGAVGGSSGAVGAPQDGILRKHFVVQLGHEIGLTAFVVTPHLPELNCFHCHKGRAKTI